MQLMPDNLQREKLYNPGDYVTDFTAIASGVGGLATALGKIPEIKQFIS